MTKKLCVPRRSVSDYSMKILFLANIVSFEISNSREIAYDMKNRFLLTYCKDENLDHKIGIYCNLIGPLAALRHCAFSCKNVLRYVGKVRHQSIVHIIQYDWLIVL